jgi:hypothetical protein
LFVWEKKRFHCNNRIDKVRTMAIYAIQHEHEVAIVKQATCRLKGVSPSCHWSLISEVVNKKRGLSIFTLFWSIMVILSLFFFNFVILPMQFQNERRLYPVLWTAPNSVNFWTKGQLWPCVFTLVLFWFYPYFHISNLAILIHNYTIQSVKTQQFLEKISNIWTNNPYKKKLTFHS